MANVTHRHIEIFHAVMTSGNLTAAAELLHTSQPTVSRELARFEKVIGLRLFERVRGRLSARRRGCGSFARASFPSPACRFSRSRCCRRSVSRFCNAIPISA